MADYNSIGGFTDEEMQEIRRLRGKVQQECVNTSVSIKDAVLWAARNELES